jgi:hypothetical protein
VTDLLNPTPEPRQPERKSASHGRFAIGDFVTPKPEWVGSANNIPSGEVRKIEPFGKDGAICVGDDKRAFVASVFLPDPAKAVGELL